MTNPAWKSIADAAPTLEALKKLSFERQILVLLARLHVMYPQMANTGGLIWENLRMPAYALALGYDEALAEAKRAADRAAALRLGKCGGCLLCCRNVVSKPQARS